MHLFVCLYNRELFFQTFMYVLYSFRLVARDKLISPVQVSNQSQSMTNSESPFSTGLSCLINAVYRFTVVSHITIELKWLPHYRLHKATWH